MASEFPAPTTPSGLHRIRVDAMSNLVKHLEPLVGKGNVIATEDGYTVSPATTQEVSAVLSFANTHSLKVRPTGGKTKQSFSNSVLANIELSLTRMNRVLEHSWQDLVCRVEAGCTWDAMQHVLSQHGQFVALDPLWPKAATVGGILATNDSGPIRHRYGSLRDLVIGMTIVLADGTIARSGGKVVKNVAGYDLCKLLTGSFGTLAVITEANFRLYPLPQYAESFTIAALNVEQLGKLASQIRHSHLLTQALQLRGDAEGFYLDIQINSHPEAKQRELLLAMVRAEGLILQPAVADVWRAREELFLDSSKVVIKATMQPSQVVDATTLIAEAGGLSVTQSLGIMTASLDSYVPVRALAKLVERTGGSVTLQQLNTETEGFGNWADTTAPIALMHALKKQFDPRVTLNPRAFLDEIDEEL